MPSNSWSMIKVLHVDSVLSFLDHERIAICPNSAIRQCYSTILAAPWQHYVLNRISWNNSNLFKLLYAITPLYLLFNNIVFILIENQNTTSYTYHKISFLKIYWKCDEVWKQPLVICNFYKITEFLASKFVKVNFLSQPFSWYWNYPIAVLNHSLVYLLNLIILSY